MTEHAIDLARRKLMTIGTAVLALIGAAIAARPFTNYFLPSERAKSLGGPVEVDLSSIMPGELRVVSWRGKPILILHRTPDMLQRMTELEDRLADPNSEESIQPAYAKNPARSINSQYLILEGRCTHLGCAPRFRPEFPIPEIKSWWRGGFVCPCHISGYDFAGRVYAGFPAPQNLRVPPHAYLSDTRVIIGVDTNDA